MTMLLSRRRAPAPACAPALAPARLDEPTAAAPAPASGAQLVIDPAAIGANTRLFAARTKGAVLAVVKADGFGHGAELVAEAALANGATWLGVTGLPEALALRRAGFQAPILSWLNPVDGDFSSAVRFDVDVAVPSMEHLAAVATAAAAAQRPALVHLHADCGMARDGAPVRVWRQLCERACALQRLGLVKVVGVMGHLGCADDPADPCNDCGRAMFAWAVRAARESGLRPAHRHLAATAATLADRRTHQTMSRIGAGLVGIGPSAAGLRFAMTLKAPVIAVRDVAPGTSVGYGHAWQAPRATRLALLGIGYADGIPRTVGDDAEVQLNGARCPVVGRVSMDQVVVDLGAVSARPGDQATVFGPGADGEPTPADWARWAGTIPHEIVTGIGPRVTRVVAP